LKKRLFHSIFLTALVTLILSVALIIPVLYQSFVEEKHSFLESEAGTIAEAMKNVDDVSYLKAITANNSTTRFTLIDPAGKVLYDSNANASQMENHSGRPEVKSALETGSGSVSRLSKTLDETTYYYALKLADGNVLRLADTSRSTLGVFGSTASLLAFLLVVVMLVAFWASNTQARAILTPLNNLDLDKPMTNDTYEELSPLLLRLEHQRKQIRGQMAELDAQKHEFEQIIDSMDEGMVIFDHDGRILTINQSAQRFFHDGRTDGNYLELCWDHQYIQTVEGALKGQSREIRLDRDDHIWQLMANPVSVDAGTFAAVLFVVDITEKANTEAMRREFSANVSHELKTPLTSIMGYTEIISQGIAKEEDVPRFIDKIHDEAARLLTLIQDIIRLSKLDETDQTAIFEPVDLKPLCGQVQGDLAKKAGKRGVTINLSGGDVTVDGLKPTLYEVVFNLVDNAIAYNVDGGTVDLTLEREGNEAVLKVKDTGIGIAPENVDRIFERFYRVDKSHSRETGGTGLGLSIVKHGTLIHKGTVTVDSVPGGGSTFTLRFPLHKA